MLRLTTMGSATSVSLSIMPARLWRTSCLPSEIVETGEAAGFGDALRDHAGCRNRPRVRIGAGRLGRQQLEARDEQIDGAVEIKRLVVAGNGEARGEGAAFGHVAQACRDGPARRRPRH